MARVEFELWLKDLTRGPLKGFGSAARSVFGGVDKDIAKTRKGLDELGNVTKIRMDTGEIERAKREIKELKSGFEEMGGGHGRRGITADIFKGGLLFEGARMAAEEGKKQLQEVFGGGMEAGMTKMELNVLAGDGAGNKLYEDTKDYIKGSMFGPQLFNQEKELLGYGEQAKNIVPLMKEMGDISMGDPVKMGSLTEVLGKVEMYGHFQQAFMRQLATTGFNPVQELYRATGKKVDPDDITTAMYKQAMVFATSKGGRFDQMQEKIMETPGGQYHRAMTNIAMEKEELGVKLLPVIGRFISAIEPMIDKLPGFMDALEPPITKLIDGFKEMLPNISAFAGGLWDLLKPIGSIFISPEFKGAMKGLLDFGVELEQDLLPVMKLLAEGIKDFLSWLPQSKADKKKHQPGNVAGYYFAPADTTMKGMVPDVAKMAKIKDSLENSGTLLGINKVFNSYKDLDKYNQTNQGNLQVQTAIVKALPTPLMAAVKSMLGGKPAVAPEQVAGSDAIMNGGSRTVIINAHFGEKMQVHVNNIKDAARETVDAFRNEFYHMVVGIPGME